MKSRIWEKKEGKYGKILAKIQLTAIFLKQAGYATNFFTQIHRDLYGDAMLVPIRMGNNMAFAPKV